jgi:predicted flap endonuclease-1-like 5' DNA nuclease
MNVLFRIVYAAHANGTHHKIALDSLRFLTAPDAEAWRRLFLSEADVYLEASKVPDKEFKDFKNHVLHVRDGFWGGAPEKVESWYKLLVRALQDHAWHEAVWAAGIMSHYYTDPVHPFHTAQSTAENEIHRAVEWSISKSYDELWRSANTLEPPALVVGSDATAIKDHVIAGAERSNRDYETLIRHYDFARGVVEPTEGLGPVARACVAELLLYAAVGTARLLDRAILDAAAAPPKVTLTAKTVIAGLKIPAKWITRKLADAADRREVEAMFDELTETGRVDATLPEDDRQVRDLHEQEVLIPRRRAEAENRARRRRDNPLPQGQIPKLRSAAGKHATAAGPLARLRRRLKAVEAPLSAALPAAEPTPEAIPTASQATPGAPVPGPQPIAQGAPAVPKTAVPVTAAPKAGPRVHLVPEDDIERAPSIGPKTARRFYRIGIMTVADFLKSEPLDIARRLGHSRITKDVVIAWQQQARLVMEIPGLRGGHAQLLIGGGLATLDEIAAADPAKAMAAILRFANTENGRHVLRDAPPPDLEKVHTWISSARSVKAAA